MPTSNRKPGKPDLTEIATISNGRDITRGDVDSRPWLTPTDPVWHDAGGMREGWVAYEGLLRDDQVAACFAQRRLAVVSRPWVVVAGGDRRIDRAAADLVRETLDTIGWDSITDQMLHARFFGFAVAEVLWEVTSDGVRIKAIKPRDRRRFVFAPDGTLKLITTRNWQGEALPPRKFWVVSVGASHADEPYGRGLAHALLGPVRMKRHGAKFWGIFLEKFGAPTVVGRFPAGTSQAERDALLNAAQAVMTDAGIILPEGVTLELLEASRTGQSGYETWMRYWDAAIAKVILGQTMTTEDGSSLAQAKVHMDVRQDIVTADADLIDASASDTWVRWLVEYVYPGAAPPRISRDMGDQEDLDKRAERDVKLYGIGLALTDEAIKRVYGDDYMRRSDGHMRGQTLEETAAGSAATKTAESVMHALHATSHARAEPEIEARVPEIMAERMVEETEAAWAEIMDAVRRLVDEAESLPALRDALLAAYGHLPAERLAEVMALGFAAAELAGRFAALAESGEPDPVAVVARQPAAPVAMHAELKLPDALGAVLERLATPAPPAEVHVDVHVPEMPAPQVTVQMPEMPAPEVRVDVHVPEMPAPQITVQPGQTVIVPTHPRQAVQTVERDEMGEIVKTIIEYKE